eukprot:scaffold305284_cov21-Prasinocladus_malaysianus.AAC.1
MERNNNDCAKGLDKPGDPTPAAPDLCGLIYTLPLALAIMLIRPLQAACIACLHSGSCMLSKRGEGVNTSQSFGLVHIHKRV